MARSKWDALASLPQPPARRGPLPTRDLSAIQLDVLCINCEEMVNVQFIEQHSRVCTRISEEVRLADRSDDPLNGVRLRISKLSLFLQHLATEAKSGEKNYLGIMVRLLQQLTDGSTIEGTQEVLKSLSSLIATFTGSDSLLLFLERVRSLALEQESALKVVELTKKKEEIISLKEQVEVQKRKVESWQRSLQKARISNIASEVTSVKSGSESSQSHTIEEEANNQLFIEEPKVDLAPDSEELKRVFFSQCLAMKLNYKAKDPAQTVPIPVLYEKALENKVPVEGWPEFISRELRQSDNWSPKAKTSKRFTARPVKTKFAYFEAIKEEEGETH